MKASGPSPFLPWCGFQDKSLPSYLCFSFLFQLLLVRTPDLCIESMGVYSPKQVSLGGGALLWWSWFLLAFLLSGRWKLLRLFQWLARKVSIDSMQNPISLRAKQGRTSLSCSMPLLGRLCLQGAQWKVEHLPSASQPLHSGKKTVS